MKQDIRLPAPRASFRVLAIDNNGKFVLKDFSSLDVAKKTSLPPIRNPSKSSFSMDEMTACLKPSANGFDVAVAFVETCRSGLVYDKDGTLVFGQMEAEDFNRIVASFYAVAS